jgi:hypothetical protein
MTMPPGGYGSVGGQVPGRWLVLIAQGGEQDDGPMVARLFDPDRRELAQFDATAEEVVVMTTGLVPEHGAIGPEWERALGQHSPDERRHAQVYTLDI